MRRRTTTRRTGELPESTSSMFPPAHSAWDYITTPLNLLTTSTRLFIGIFNVPVHQVPRARVRGRTRPDHPAAEERSQSEDPAGQGGLTQKYMKIQIHKKVEIEKCIPCSVWCTPGSWSTTHLQRRPRVMRARFKLILSISLENFFW